MSTNASPRYTTTWSNNRLSSTTYDAAGAITNWNGAVYQYDEAGMMWNMKSGSEDWLYIYTADDERIIVPLFGPRERRIAGLLSTPRGLRRLEAPTPSDQVV